MGTADDVTPRFPSAPRYSFPARFGMSLATAAMRALASGVTPSGWRQHQQRIASSSGAATSSRGLPFATDVVVPGRSRRDIGFAPPDVAPPLESEVRALASFVADAERLLVITGAGVSTESAIPDYRSPRGAYSRNFKPMTHQDFMRSEENRRRYWARSFVGWNRFAERTVPNAAHDAIAALQREGHVWRLITQNVDRLHQRAGADPVLELHGTTHEVVCLACGDVTPRRTLQRALARLNPEMARRLLEEEEEQSASKKKNTTAGSSAQRPDGDAEMDASDAAAFSVPACASCRGGPLKPAVVFFGDGVPAATHASAAEASAGADAVLIVGSSVSTFSAFRLVRDAARRGAPVAILNAGETRCDDVATLKVERLVGETMPLVLDAVRRVEMYGYC